jgi:hypothetical protein
MSVILRRKKAIKECDACGYSVSAPIQTVSNTIGVGNAIPAQSAAMCAVDQASSSCIGSGDLFQGSNKINMQSGQIIKKNKKRIKYRKKKSR